MDLQRQRHLPWKSTASFVVIVASVTQLLTPHLLPNGPAVDIPMQHRPASVPVDPTNVSLRLASGKVMKIYERIEDGREPLLIHPETILFDSGTMF